MRKARPKRIKIDTFPKAITSIIVVHGFFNIDLSYILAFMDKEPVSDVSVAMVTEILAPICVYLVTNTIANIFEKNYLSFSIPKNSPYMQSKKRADKYTKTE